MTDRVGQVLGGRYRLIAPIGTGASASVYLADDVTLRRRVAVKILHDALADDAAFLKRFRAEAQAAAALNHPHIMAVYDWGQGDVPYLVTEYLGGGSLRSMLDVGSRLSLAQTLLVGVEAVRGLEYAHRQGFVHRDIKPANLLFDEDARLRIADFGLARALAEAAWTEPMGAVMGTARYASPEQARGLPLDGRSDVYSLALVLVEAVTGEVPFSTDTTLGTLMARVDQVIPVPDELGPLRVPIMAAGVPNPADRPDSAAFSALLMTAARDLDRPRPLPLAGAMVVDLGDGEDRDPTTQYVSEQSIVAEIEPEIMRAPTGVVTDGIAIVGDDAAPAQPVTRSYDRDGVEGIGPSAAAVATAAAAAATTTATTTSEAAAPSATPDGPSRKDRRARRKAEKAGRKDAETSRKADSVDTGATDEDVVDLTAAEPAAARPDTSPAPAPAELYDGADDLDTTGERTTTARRRRWPALVVGLLVVAAAALAGWGYWYTNVREATFAVPELVGTNEADLDAALEAGDWQVQINPAIYAEGTVPGQILSQDPEAGVQLKEGATIEVTPSLGAPPVAVPADLVDKTFDEAKAQLEAVGLTAADPEQPWSEDHPQGIVMSVAEGTPAELPKGSPVTLVVSNGPEPRTIPADLVGLGADDVIAQLRGLGLEVQQRDVPHETVKAGIVLGVEPGSGNQVPRGSLVLIEVSSGPPVVPVPAVKGLSVTDATATLEAKGLAVSGVQGNPTQQVQNTTPATGTEVRRGTAVTLITG